MQRAFLLSNTWPYARTYLKIGVTKVGLHAGMTGIKCLV